MSGEETFKSLLTALNKNIMSFNEVTQIKSWAPHIYCVKCVTLPIGWKNGSRHMPCALPWTEPTHHSPDTFGITCQSKHGDKSEFTFRNENRSTVKN